MAGNGVSTVLLADSHEQYRHGLERAIIAHPALTLVAVTDNGDEAMSLILRMRPAVALLDVRLPGIDGFAIGERLAVLEPPVPTRLVLLLAVPDRTQIVRTFGAGAFACLAKEASRLEICETLIAAAHGEPSSCYGPIAEAFGV